MAKKKKRKKTTKARVEQSSMHTLSNKVTAIAYTEDVCGGEEDGGIKLSSAAVVGRSVGISNERLQSIGDVKLTKREKRQRLERLSRFATTEDDNSMLNVIHLSPAVKRWKREVIHESSVESSSSTNVFEAKEGFGTCQKLEKPYLRLTSAAKPENTRPLRVLKLAFEHVKHRYKVNDDKYYAWTNEQLKSIRQDLTVQSLTHTDFALTVYETNARISLEHGDLNEFNQCLTMMQAFVLDTNQSNKIEQTKKNADEFAAYRLLYSLIQKEWAELQALMIKIHQKKKRRACRHALEVVNSVLCNKFCTFFKLYNNECPNLSAYMMDYLVQRVRLAAYPIIVSAYRPKLNLESFCHLLGFHDNNEAISFLRYSNAIILEEKDVVWIDCKASQQRLVLRC